MIIGNFKSKADEIEKKAQMMRLLQISVENETEITNRLKGFVAQIPPPVPEQEKSIAELEKDEMSLRQKLTDELTKLGLKPDVVNYGLQNFLSEGNGIDSLVILARSIPAIKKKFTNITPEFVDSSYLNDIFKAIVKEYRISLGFIFNNSGKLTVNENTIQTLLATSDKLLTLKGLLNNIKKLSLPNSENFIQSDILLKKIDFTNNYIERLGKRLAIVDSVSKAELLKETVNLIDKNILLSGTTVRDTINTLKNIKSSEQIPEALNKLSTALQPEQVKNELSNVEEELGDFDEYINYNPPPLTENELEQIGLEDLEDINNTNEELKFAEENKNNIFEYLDDLNFFSESRENMMVKNRKKIADKHIEILTEFINPFTKMLTEGLPLHEQQELIYNNVVNTIKNYKKKEIEFNNETERIMNYIENKKPKGDLEKRDIKDFFVNAGLKGNKGKETLDAMSIKLGDKNKLYAKFFNDKTSLYNEQITNTALNKAKTNPNYDPEFNPASQMNRVIGLGKGKEKSFNPTRIKIGKGVARQQEQPRYRTFGKYVVHNDQLQESNRLNFKYPSLGLIPHIKPIPVSDNYKEFILDILDNDKMNSKHYESLKPEEKTHFHRVVEGAGLVGKFKLKKLEDDVDEKEMNRFNILKGSLLAGNNNPQMIKELKGLTVKFIKGGKIEKKQGEELLYYLLEY